MANPIFSPPVNPSVGSAPDNEVNLLTAAFGDGYEQVQPDGLNARRAVWRLTWQTLSRAQADAIVTFLDARGGAAVFDWTPPGDAAASQFRCPQWSPPRPEAGDDVFSVTATFRQAFDVVA